MKDQFKNPLKCLLLFLFLVLSACEKDLYEENIKQSHSTKTETLTGKEAEKIASRLNTFLKSHNLGQSDVFSKTITLDMGTISYDEILKIIDSYGKENYTFEIISPEESYKKFANLVLQEKEGFTTIKIIEYEMTEEFALQYGIDGNIKEFKGAIKILPIYSNGPCPEPQLVIQIGNIPPDCFGCGGGSVGGNVHEVPGGIATNPGGSGYSDPLVGSINDDDDGEPGDEDETGEWDGVHDWHSKLAIDPIIPTDPTAPADPCPPITEIGILNPVNICSKTFLQGLSNDGINSDRAWLYNHTGIHNELMNYIKNSANCNEANLFATEMLHLIRQDAITFTSIKPFLIEKQIDDSQLDDCTKIILNKLKQNHTIAKIIARFDNPQSIFTLNLSQVPNLVNNDNQSVYGNTSIGSTLYSYDIKLNGNNFKNDGATSLGKATTIIHEILHALIMSVIQNQGNPNNTDMNDYPEIWNEYVLLKTGSTNDSNHVSIANYLKDIMASALQEYITGNVVSDPNQLEVIYKDLSWSGLFKPFPSEPTHFDNVLTNDDKLRISIRKKVEMSNSPFNLVPPSNNPPCLP